MESTKIRSVRFVGNRQFCQNPTNPPRVRTFLLLQLLIAKGYQREITKLRGRRKEASQLMPRVHRVASLLKRWLLGTHQGAVAPPAPAVLPG